MYGKVSPYRKAIPRLYRSSLGKPYKESTSILLTIIYELWLLPRGASCSGLVIPVFRGGKRTYIEKDARPRKDRNPVPEAVREEQSAFALFSRREPAIHYSGPNLDSGGCSVVQYRSSTQAGNREKTGMTVPEVVYNERRTALIQAFFSPLLYSVCGAIFCCAADVPSFGKITEEA